MNIRKPLPGMFLRPDKRGQESRSSQEEIECGLTLPTCSLGEAQGWRHTGQLSKKSPRAQSTHLPPAWVMTAHWCGNLLFCFFLIPRLAHKFFQHLEQPELAQKFFFVPILIGKDHSNLEQSFKVYYVTRNGAPLGHLCLSGVTSGLLSRTEVALLVGGGPPWHLVWGIPWS